MAKHVSASGSIVVDRPVGTVFAFFADGENDPRWRGGVLSMTRNGPLGEGATYTQKVSGPGGRAVDADIRVTAYEPEHRLAFVGIAGPVSPQGEYVFEPAGNGTRVTFSLSAELPAIKGLVMASMVQKTMDAEVAALPKAKAVLEAG
ncbi:MAG TPA: SRPBCC family protein [Propionibacteriaceae bacterium]|nr:SRPBCC family protein [Propionibacteriaceae bacterium]